MRISIGVAVVVGWLLVGSTVMADGRALEVRAPPSSGETTVLQGVVTYRDSGEPAIGATVVIANTGLAALTDGDGRWRIEGVPLGSHQIDVIMVRESLASKLVTVKKGATLDIALEIPELHEASEVIIVTGTRSPEKVFDAPIAVAAVSGKDIERAAGPSYLSALADAKGVDFADAGVIDQRISTRGFNTQFNSRMLSMVDGRLARLPGSGLAQGNMVPSTALDMKAVEVVMGPASALYGADAHAGVVNVVTKTPWDESGVSAALRGGTQEMVDGAVRLAGTVGDRLGWKINGQYLRARDFAPDRSADTHYYDTSVFEGDLVEDYDVGLAKIDGAAYYQYGEWIGKAAAGFSETDMFSMTNAGRNHLRDWQVQYQSAQLSHPRWYAQVTRTASDAGRTYQLERLAAAAEALVAAGETVTPERLDPIRADLAFVDRSQLIESELQHRLMVLDTRVTLGGQVRLFMPDSGGTYLADAGGADIDATQVGAYAQLDRRVLGDRLRVLLAGRVDHHTDYPTQLSPKAGLVYEVAPSHRVRVAYNRAFKSPTILENYLLINEVLRGNRDGFTIRDGAGNLVREVDPLVPEGVHSVEVGYRGALGSRVFLDAVAYHSWHQDFISPLTRLANPADPMMPTFGFGADGEQVGDGTLFTYVNFGSARVQGADLSVDVAPIAGVRVAAGGSWIRLAHFTSEPGLSDLLLNVPRVKLKASVTADNLGFDGWFVKLAGRWTSAYEFESGYWSASRFFDDGKVPARFVADVSCGYQLPRGLSLQASVMNAFDDHRVDVLGAPTPGRMAFLQLVFRQSGLDY